MRKFITAVLISLCLFSTATAEAFDFNPSVSLTTSEAYNDNIQLFHTNRESDFITYVTPAVSFMLDSSRSQLAFSYSPSFNFYASHSFKNNTSQNASGSGTFALSDRLNLSISDTYLKSQEINDLLTLTNYGPIRSTTQTSVNTLNGNLSYKLSDHLTYLLGGSFSDTQLEGSDTFNTNVYSGNTGFAYSLNTRTTFSINAAYTRSDFKAGNNSDFQNYTLGITHKFTPTVTLAMTGGVVLTNLQDTGKQTTDFTGSVALTKNFEKGSATLSYIRSVVPGVEESQPLTTDAVSLNFSRPLAQRWTASLTGSYIKSSSTTGISAFKSDEERAAASLSYAIRPWATASLSYTFVDLSDKINSSSSYYNNVAMLMFTVSYPPRKPKVMATSE